MDAPDTRKSSAITDHPFVPQTKRPWLCQGCRLAEAAHSETTVKRWNSVLDEPCHCTNPERNSYEYRVDKRQHCEQCDGLMP
jgi:hypothetical protein